MRYASLTHPTDSKQLTTNNKQPTTNNQQPTTTNQQPTTNNQQPTTNNQQPTTILILQWLRQGQPGKHKGFVPDIYQRMIGRSRH